MTPAEHYEKAELLLAGHKGVLDRAKARIDANPALHGTEAEVKVIQLATPLLLEAQVHATLATLSHQEYMGRNVGRSR